MRETSRGQAPIAGWTFSRHEPHITNDERIAIDQSLLPCRFVSPELLIFTLAHTHHVDVRIAFQSHNVRDCPSCHGCPTPRTNTWLRSYGESHCLSVGCIVDGVPPGMELTEADIQPQMTRRRPGQSAITTPRNEKDKVEIQSGTEFGVTLGTPIGMRVMNENQRPKDYGNSTMDLYPRPSHADWTYLEKYGVKASSGGGRSSARETIGPLYSSSPSPPSPY